MKKITIYGRMSCPYCKMAVDLCDSKNLNYEYIDILASKENADKKDELAQKYNHFTVPLVLVGDEFVGGYDDFSASL